jgi:hypothetical protein
MELFRASPKAAAWERHNELLGATGGRCGECHDDGRASLTIEHLSDCITCHENHAVMRPTVAMLGDLPETPCAFCHEGTGRLAGVVPEPPEKAKRFAETRSALLATADRMRLEGDERFDWLVDQAVKLPNHRERAEFARLFEKFRIGKTHYSYRDPATGRDMKVSVRRCTNCHLIDGFTGKDTSKALLADTRSVTSMIARAERILLTAQRGGVEVRSVRPELESAVDNQIELEALVHTFSTDGEFKSKRTEALANAEAALHAGQRSLDELSYRRRGLWVALGVILAALVALALKIRQMS